MTALRAHDGPAIVDALIADLDQAGFASAIGAIRPRGAGDRVCVVVFGESADHVASARREVQRTSELQWFDEHSEIPASASARRAGRLMRFAIRTGLMLLAFIIGVGLAEGVSGVLNLHTELEHYLLNAVCVIASLGCFAAVLRLLPPSP